MQLGFIRNGKIIQIKEIEEIPVMPDGLCTPPPQHTHCPVGHNTMGYLYYNVFLGSALYKGERLVKKAHAEIERKCTSLPSPALFRR